MSKRNQNDCIVPIGSRLISNNFSMEAISLSLPDNAYDLSSNFTKPCNDRSCGASLVSLNSSMTIFLSSDDGPDPSTLSKYESGKKLYYCRQKLNSRFQAGYFSISKTGAGCTFPPLGHIPGFIACCPCILKKGALLVSCWRSVG